jgi:hypothetical protein
MRKSTDGSWHEFNQQYLMAAVGLVREHLERFRPGPTGDGSLTASGQACGPGVIGQVDELPDIADKPTALDTLAALFGLSTFERSILLLCAGVELDSSLADLCATIHGDMVFPHPTFGLALAALPDAHWSALSPSGPLRYWRLVEIGAGPLLTKSPLRIDEWILHYLTGIPQTDERLVGIVETPSLPDSLVPSHRSIVDRLTRVWSQADCGAKLPVIQLCGEDTTGRCAIAVTACCELGLKLRVVSARMLPSARGELDGLIRLWEREAALSGSMLLIECDGSDASDTSHFYAVSQFCNRMKGDLIISGNASMRAVYHPTLVLDVCKPTTGEQRILWRDYLGERIQELDGEIEAMVSQFNLGTQGINLVSSEALRYLAASTPNDEGDSNGLGRLLWDTCRAYTRPQLDHLAQRITPKASWDDLVLPAHQKQILSEITMHVRQRSRVYDTWGFAAQSERGLGIGALFTGESGTGKTMAAEVLANELALDLYRIDLSQVVSKYIGETEKNLGRVFDAAEEGGAILLFDEADSLFGKRSEVRDSHDRYANIEVSYLLQRMEAYRGLAILTTNMKSALDKAFLRRIRFVVRFPFPDLAHRAQIWERVFPSDVPLEEIDIDKLARLNIAGGNIRSIALNAAFLAADEDRAVCMPHLWCAARSEYAKLEKPFGSTGIG